VSNHSRRWLKLELGVGVAFLVLIAAGLLAPRLWRWYERWRTELRIVVRADGTVLADGRRFNLDPEAEGWVTLLDTPRPSPATEKPNDNEAFRQLIKRRADKLLPVAQPRPPGVKPDQPYSKLSVRLSVAPQVSWKLVRMITGICRENDVWNVSVNNTWLPPADVTCDYYAPSSELCLTWREGRLEALLIEPPRASGPYKQRGTLPELCGAVSQGRVWIYAENRVPLSDVLEAVRLLMDGERDVRLLVSPWGAFEMKFFERLE